MTQTGLSMNWLYNGAHFPLWSCPWEQVLVGENVNVDGSHCLALFTALDTASLLRVDGRIVVGSPSNTGSLVYGVPCSTAVTLVSSSCILNGWGDDFPVPQSRCTYNVSPMCDSLGSVSVGQILTLRGLLASSIIIIALYAIVALSAIIRAKGTTLANRQRRLDVSRSFADASAKEMTKMVERDWTHFEARKGRSSLVAETGSLRSPSPSVMSNSPREAFVSDQWRFRLSKSLGSEARARRRVALFLQKLQTGLCVWVIFFALTVGVMQLLLFVLPLNYYRTTVRSVASVVMYNASLLSATFTSSATWVDFVLVADLCIELLLVVLSAAVVGSWPRLPIKVPHLVKTRSQIRRGVESDFSQAAADGAIYAETIAAVLVVRESCTSDSRRLSLVKRIQNLLTMFPPDSIFVVDSNPYSTTPVDATWQTVYTLSPQIKYCFVPDCDSKLFALFWFNSVWLPFLVKSGQAQTFSHLLVLQTGDDELSLPALPLDLTLPRENLALNADNLRAMHLPVSAATSATTTGSLVPCQDFDLKMRAIRRLAESRCASCLEVELCASVWERSALADALRSASSNEVSPLQQQQTSLGVLKLRARNHMTSNPFAFVQKSVPTRFTDLLMYRMRTNQAGEIVKAGSAVREIFSVMSLCSIYAWIAKIPLLLGTVISGLCQLMRPFVLGTLVFRDPIAIGCIAACSVVILLALEVVMLLVFAGRSDLRQKWSIGPLLVYPAYRAVSCWVIELPVLIEYILGGCVKNAALSPEKRLRDLQDAPACPPSHVVNWFTVWKFDDDPVSDFYKENGSGKDSQSIGDLSPLGRGA